MKQLQILTPAKPNVSSLDVTGLIGEQVQVSVLRRKKVVRNSSVRIRAGFKHTDQLDMFHSSASASGIHCTN